MASFEAKGSLRCLMKPDFFLHLATWWRYFSGEILKYEFNLRIIALIL